MLKLRFRLFCVLMVLAAMFAVSGCGDTWEGWGEDVEDVGEDIQD